jgi:DNA repair protein RadD
VSLVLRDYQASAIDAVFSYYKAGNKGNSVVAMPTGTGKSPTIAGFICRVFSSWPGQKIIVCAHAAELLKQNSDTLRDMWPSAPFGIFSAELGRKETIWPITFAGIGSIVNHAAAFGRVNVLVVDECQLVSDVESSQYRKFIAALKLINPGLIVIGFSATPYRLKVGLITDGTLFDDIVYDITDFNSFNDLVSRGFLAPLISRKTQAEYDLESVGLVAGEYNQKQLARAVSKSEITEAACREIIQKTQDRNCGIVFADSIEHCEEIAYFLQDQGETCGIVHSRQSKKINDEIMALHRAGLIKWLINKDKLTTGYDWPPLDACAMLRHTKSPGLWVQMLGRLTRPFDFQNPRHAEKCPGFNYTKGNALVLDFARNSDALGPINDPKLPKAKGKGTGDVPIKICDHCGTYNHPSKRFCDDCLQPFSFKAKIEEKASQAEVMKSPTPVVEWFDVGSAYYEKIRSRTPGQPSMMLAKYTCPHYHAPFTEVINIEHPEGHYGRKKAVEWWQRRNTAPIEAPRTVDQALRLNAALRRPSRLRVHLNAPGRPKILSEEF